MSRHPREVKEWLEGEDLKTTAGVLRALRELVSTANSAGRGRIDSDTWEAEDHQVQQAVLRELLLLLAPHAVKADEAARGRPAEASGASEGSPSSAPGGRR